MITKFRLYEKIETEPDWKSDKKVRDIIKARNLIKSSVNLNQKDSNGWLPLKVATSSDIEVMKMLITAGAKPNVEIFNYLMPPTMGGGTDNVNAKAKLLIDTGFDLNDKNIDDQTPLICAAVCNQINVMRYLLNAGADPFIMDSQNKCFIDHLNKQNFNKIKNEYPEIYDEYLMRKDAGKYNL